MPTNEALNENGRSVLDHGYVKLIEPWGSDERIIEAARMSTAKGFVSWGQLFCSCGATSTTAFAATTEPLGPGALFHDDANTRCPVERGGAHVATPTSTVGDEKLLRYLWTHRHATPFEMAGLTIEVQAPIFVFREWHRHRTQSYNEMSARYTPLPDLNYVPSVERLLSASSKRNQQASAISGAPLMTAERAEEFRSLLVESYTAAERLYQFALAGGVPKELARVHLPVGRYSRMRASANLRNWLAFLSLRLDPAAQWEIRQYASVVDDIVRELFPRTWSLFSEGR